MLFMWVKFKEKRPISSLGLFKEGALTELSRGWLVGSVLFGACLILTIISGSGVIETVRFTADKLIWFLILLLDGRYKAHLLKYCVVDGYFR